MNIKPNLAYKESFFTKHKKGVVGAFVVFVIVVLVLYISYTTNSTLFSNVRSAINTGNYNEAVLLLESYQEANPSSIKGYELYADLYLAQNKPEMAICKLWFGVEEVEGTDKNVLQKRVKSIMVEYDLDGLTIEKIFKSSCSSIDFKTLVRNPSKQIGNSFKFTGEVTWVQESSYDNIVELKINVTEDDFGNWDDTIYATIEIPEGEDKILEDDIITFWGTCEGEADYISIFDSNVALPEISIKYYELVE